MCWSLRCISWKPLSGSLGLLYSTCWAQENGVAGIVGKLWEIVGKLLRGRMWERPCQLPLIREIVGRLKNYEINCGKIVGKPGREILFFLVFWWFGAAAPRVFLSFVSCLRRLRRAAEISIYIHGPRQTSAAKSSHGSSGSLQLLRHRRGGRLHVAAGPEALVHRLPLFGGAVEAGMWGRWTWSRKS